MERKKIAVLISALYEDMVQETVEGPASISVILIDRFLRHRLFPQRPGPFGGSADPERG